MQRQLACLVLVVFVLLHTSMRYMGSQGSPHRFPQLHDKAKLSWLLVQGTTKSALGRCLTGGRFHWLSCAGRVYRSHLPEDSLYTPMHVQHNMETSQKRGIHVTMSTNLGCCDVLVSSHYIESTILLTEDSHVSSTHS